MHLIHYGPEGSFPARELAYMVFESLRERKQSRVAIMADEEAAEALPSLSSEWLDPEKDYHWSGFLIQKKVQKPAKRVIIGGYAEWFRWYMRHQRFRTFHTLVLIEPLTAVSDEERGGYIDGLLARLMGKVRQVIVVARGTEENLLVVDESRVEEVLRALLYGRRLTRPELLEQTRHTFVPIPRETLKKVLETYRYTWRISKDHPRLRLEEFDEELLQGMVASTPHDSLDGKSGQIEQLFRRKERFVRELAVPDEMLREKALEDASKAEWITVPYEAGRASEWLEGLNKAQDPRLGRILHQQEYVTDEQWVALLSPPRKQVRRILDGFVAEGKLERRLWFREIGRPARAYFPLGKAPFLDQRCGQCAFYVSVRRRCNLWWLVNKKHVFFDPKWKQTGSPVSAFEIHKMRYASRIGSHSSACMRFIDKKRDHLRKVIPAKCEVCGEGISASGSYPTCPKCKTRYVRFRDKVKVMTAYEHEYNRLYHEITDGDAKADLHTWKREMASTFQRMLEKREEPEDLDMLAEEAMEQAVEPTRVWLGFDDELQERVDRLSQSMDITRRLCVTMVQSAVNATRRIATIAKLYPGDIGQSLDLQEKYLALIKDARSTSLLTYEAMAMKHYWFCYNLAVKKAQQWFGPRKRSRFVREFVDNPTGRARGYSAVDAAINYLHQRRLRHAERINAEVGFPGTCDGFLHKEKYNSRRIGLLLDMIDPYKFADREILLAVVLNGGISWKDFKLEKDRRGSTFYYPSSKAVSVLNQVGKDADDEEVFFDDRKTRLEEAYRLFATGILSLLYTTKPGESGEFKTFLFPITPSSAHVPL